jgi:hypothetical protein
MQPEMTPISVIDQAVIRFAGHDFLVVRVPDGRVAVVLSHLCEALDLDRRAQTRRIQSHTALAKHLLLVRIKTPGGPQVVNALVTSALALWLGGFRLGRHSEEKQALIRLLQTDAADAFTSQFYQVDTQAQAKVSQSPQPSLPTPDMSSMSVFDMLRAIAGQIVTVTDRMEQEQREMAAWRSSMNRQHDQEVAWMADARHQMQLQREEMDVLWSVILGSASAVEGPLSADHQQTLQLLLHREQQVTGQPRAALERELLKAAGVAELRHLQETDWKQIVAWFRQRLGW